MHTPRMVGRGRKAAPDAAFELWLGRSLQAMYGGIANEPLPPELLALIERDRAAEPATPTPAKWAGN
jgi:hypothetical protein